MFTGLIEGTGSLVRVDRRGPDAQMVVEARYSMEKVRLGESIAVDGACLTVTAFQGSVFTVDVSAETLDRTTLGRKSRGALLNLERALKLGDRLGGHLVTGHVDGVGTLRDLRREGRSWRLLFQVPATLMGYLVAKGSVAVNGISLTVNGCYEDAFDVNVVPHTAETTTIERLQAGEEVNIETDLIGKYVEKMLRSWKGSMEQSESEERIDVGFLQKHGFID